MASIGALSQMLETGVVELRFARRNQTANQAPTRRMIATNSQLLLSSLEGSVAFRYNKPTGQRAYNPNAKGLVIAYDLLKLDFRAIPASNAQVLSFRPTTNEEELKEFWEYFANGLQPMSSTEKEKFVNS